MYQVSKSSEDYLEIIYELNRKKGRARVKDIALGLNVKLPSVTEMLKKLSDKGFVRYEKYGKIKLTPEGRTIAKSTYNKHKLLTKFFISLGIDKKTAIHDACMAEHILSKKTINKIDEYVRSN